MFNEKKIIKFEKVKGSNLDCMSESPRDSNTKQIFDQRTAKTVNIPVMDATSGEVHLSKTGSVLNKALFSDETRGKRNLQIAKRYSASIILPNGEVRKYILPIKNKDAAIEDISQYVTAIEDAIGKECVWQLDQTQVFYIGKKHIGATQVERLKAQCKVLGNRLFGLLFDTVKEG